VRATEGLDGNAAGASELADGLWEIRTELPGHPLGSMNSYLLQSGDGAVVIDTPWGREDVRDAFVGHLRDAGTGVDDVRLVLLTHYHDDHSGSAGFLQRAGARVAIHTDDLAVMRDRFVENGYEELLLRWLRRVGADAELTRYALEQQDSLRARFEAPAVDRLLVAGEMIAVGPWHLEVVHTPGHTPGSVCFFEHGSRALFSGDHVFPRRRSNAVHRPIGADRPLQEYWRAMDRLSALRPTRVMPGHEASFADFDDRIAELAAVRDWKLEELAGLLADGPATASELARSVRRRRPWDALDGNARVTAIGEVLAYLIELEQEARIDAADDAPQLWRIRKGEA